MPDPKLRLGFREPDVDTNMPFVDGSVKIEGFDLEIVPFTGPDSVDAWDASFGGLMQTKGKGDHPFVSIPAGRLRGDDRRPLACNHWLTGTRHRRRGSTRSSACRPRRMRSGHCCSC